jgi:hypothetical protein
MTSCSRSTAESYRMHLVSTMCVTTISSSKTLNPDSMNSSNGSKKCRDGHLVLADAGGVSILSRRCLLHADQYC